MLRFYGTKDSIQEYRELVVLYTGKTASGIELYDDRHTFTVDLTAEDREILQERTWYQKSPRSDSPWNHRVGYEVLS